MTVTTVTSLVLPDLQTHAHSLSARAATINICRQNQNRVLSWPRRRLQKARAIRNYNSASDFLTYFFFLDDLSDELGKLIPNQFDERIAKTATLGFQHRFVETFDLFFQSIHDQLKSAPAVESHTVENNIVLRRDTFWVQNLLAIDVVGKMCEEAIKQIQNFPDASAVVGKGNRRGCGTVHTGNVGLDGCGLGILGRSRQRGYFGKSNKSVKTSRLVQLSRH
ncbi:hypothetical protein B0H14DRAFT_2639878 [Mycena olivaceomarginata]|nr:hypothetical protein B0H14DRAFT_2639878 [Mycena olivaceomarginata]